MLRRFDDPTRTGQSVCIAHLLWCTTPRRGVETSRGVIAGGRHTVTGERGVKQVGMQQAVEAFCTGITLGNYSCLIAEHPATHESHDSSLEFYAVRLYSQTLKAFIKVHHENNS